MNVRDDEVSVRRSSLLRTTLLLGLLFGALGFTHSLQASTSRRTAPSCRVGDVSPFTPRDRSYDRSYAVDARGLVRVYRRPGGRAFARFGALNQNGVPMVFAALEAVLGPRCKAAWYRVRVPVKPNGTTGYVRARSVNLRLIRTQVVVDLSARRLTVYRRGRADFSTTTAIGAPTTPTPLGDFYVNQRFREADPNGPYGWAAIGISAFSEVLTQWPQGGQVAIHGTNRPALLGLPISNGCIRVSNAAIQRIWRLAPAGTPVSIRR
jgi:lipoprotein-anchoring transpeptidase ErfK/SrfK